MQFHCYNLGPLLFQCHLVMLNLALDVTYLSSVFYKDILFW
jgi:hypothetical protein